MSRLFDGHAKKQVVFSKETIAEIEQAIRFWAKSIGFHCFYESFPNCFGKVESLFATPATHLEQQNFLIEHGLAEAAVASLFFKNVVKKNGGIISAGHVMQSFVLDEDSFFEGENLTGSATAHDIRHFPFLRDSNRYACGVFFEGRDEVNWFERLDGNRVFWRKSVLAFLPILWTPAESIYAIFDRFVTDKAAVIFISDYYVRRKLSLGRVLDSSERFDPICEKLSQTEVGAIISEMSAELNVSKIICNLQVFTNSRIARQMEKIFSDLEKLIELSSAEWGLRSVNQESVLLYTPLIGFRDAFHKTTIAFFEAELSDDMLFRFFRKMTSLLKGMESLPLAVSATTNMALHTVLQGVKNVLSQLQVCFFDSFDLIDSKEGRCDLNALRLEKLVPQEFSEGIALWIKAESERTQQLKNKPIMTRIFEQLYGEYERGQATYLNQASVAVTAVSSWATSLFSKRVVVQAPLPAHDLSGIRLALYSAEEPQALFLVIAQLLSLHGRDIDRVHTQFVIELMKQYQREYISRTILCAACENPNVVYDYVREQREGVADAQLMPTALAFVKEMQPVSEVCFRESDGWLSVAHTSQSMLQSGRLAPVSAQSEVGIVRSQESMPTAVLFEGFSSDDFFKEGGEFRPMSPPH